MTIMFWIFLRVFSEHFLIIFEPSGHKLKITPSFSGHGVRGRKCGQCFYEESDVKISALNGQEESRLSLDQSIGPHQSSLRPPAPLPIEKLELSACRLTNNPVIYELGVLGSSVFE